MFSASVGLWEALTGKRLFYGGDEGQVIYRILSGPIEPPSSIAPDLPPSLDEIALRGLARPPGERFGSAKEMARALEGSLSPASASEVGDYVHHVAGALLRTRASELAAIESDGATALDPQVSAEQDTDGSKKPRRFWKLGAPWGLVAIAGIGIALFAAKRGALGAAAPSPSSSSVAAPSAVAPAPSPLPASSEVADAPPPTSSAPSHHARGPSVRNPGGSTCDPPFTIDSAGYKHYKRECVR